MSQQSIIEHRANYYYVEFREDFLQICQACTYKKPVKEGQKSKASPHCKALVLSIMEGWTNHKRGRGNDLYIYMSYAQWIDAMYGMFGRNAILDSLDELIGEGLLSRERYRMYGKDTYKYLLNCAEVNSRIRALPERDPHTTLPQTNAFTSKPVTRSLVNGSESHPSQSKPDPFINKPDTHLLVNATGLQVNEDPFLSKHNIESNRDPSQHQNTESKERETQPGQDTTPPASSLSPSSEISLGTKQALVSHPEHNFLWFDDLLVPTKMVVVLTPAFPHPHWSELEDKRRERIAMWEVKPLLEEQGLSMTVEWKHEEEPPLVVQSRNKGDGITQERASASGGLLASLTEEESTFWTRWCVISKCDPESLNENAYNHVKFFAPKGLGTDEVQSLYDLADARICEYSKALGKDPIPPRLGNLKKAYPDWEKSRERKDRERVEEEKHHQHVPGTGWIDNQEWKKNAPPVDYSLAIEQASRPTRRPKTTVEAGSMGDVLAKIREQRRL